MVLAKCDFAKRTQLENGILAMRDWVELVFDDLKNEPKRTRIGHFRTQNGAEMRKNWSDGVLGRNWKGDMLKHGLRTWDTGLSSPVDPQTGKSALPGRGLGRAGVGFEFLSAAADPATAGHSRAPGKCDLTSRNASWRTSQVGNGGKIPAQVGKKQSEVGTDFRFCWGNREEVGISRFFPGGEPLVNLGLSISDCGFGDRESEDLIKSSKDQAPRTKLNMETSSSQHPRWEKHWAQAQRWGKLPKPPYCRFCRLLSLAVGFLRGEAPVEVDQI
jgi:hypothetical protein